MFDFTKEVKLDERNYTLYRKLQFLLYLGAILLAFYLAFVIIFPKLPFTFSFLNPNSSKNTVFNPRLLNNDFPEKGKFKENILFNTNFSGSYSTAKINLNLSKKSSLPDSLNISVRKSYQAFLYTSEGLIGFKDGSFLKNNGSFYIVSEGKLRKFNNITVLSGLGYLQENFKEVSIDDLKYNSLGEEIRKNNEYPDSTFFRIDDNYYILENQILKKFISDEAFLSSYNNSQAIKKDIGFLNNYPVSEDLAGFADGTIIAYDISAYIINGNQILPISDTQTFENKGFDWEDVIKVGSDEIANYEKGKLFTMNNSHTNGFVFKTIEDSKYYIIKDGKKYSLPTENIAKSWLKKEPIMVSEKSLKIKNNCQLNQSPFNSKSYSCEIPLDIFDNLIGTSYEFELETSEEIKLDSIDVNFKKNIDFKNLKEFFSGLISRIKKNYV